MYVDLYKNNRSSLSDDQKDFLQRVVPLARYIQEQTLAKALFKGLRSPAGIFTSIVTAEILVESGWGTHPLSKSRYEDRELKIRKNVNNLSLIESNPHWKGQTVEYHGKEYKCYERWQDYAINISDHYAFSGEYNDLLLSDDLEKQIELLSKNRNFVYKSRLLALIEMYGLEEFDYGRKEKSDRN